MALEYRHNNGYDTVLLVENGIVRSVWTVTADVIRDFCNCSQLAEDWDDQGGIGHGPEDHDYGTLIAVRRGYELDAIDPARWAGRVEFFLH